MHRLHTKDQRPMHLQSNAVYAIQCNKKYPDIKETEQSFYKPTAQHRIVKAFWQVTAIHLHLKDKDHSFKGSNVKTENERRGVGGDGILSRVGTYLNKYLMSAKKVCST